MSSGGFGGQEMGHDEFREWARAALGDPRQVYARRADAAPGDRLVFMPDGETDRFREAAKSGELICPVPQCPSPKLITREYEDRRDHFMHVQAPDGRGHGRSYMRIATQRLLLGWAEEQDGVDEVLVGEMDGVSVALLARLDDGREVALCYVDQRLGADAWVEHNDLLHSEGLGVAWIFALRKTYFSLPDPAEPEAERRTDLILDRPIYKRMREKGSWPLLINLEQQVLANVVKPDGGPARRLKLAPTALDRVQHIVVSPLADCELCRYGIATPKVPIYTLEASRKNWRWRR